MAIGHPWQPTGLAIGKAAGIIALHHVIYGRLSNLKIDRNGGINKEANFQVLVL